MLCHNVETMQKKKEKMFSRFDNNLPLSNMFSFSKKAIISIQQIICLNGLHVVKRPTSKTALFSKIRVKI